MEKILITGGNGLLGTKLIEKALGLYQVVSLGREQCHNRYLGDFSFYQLNVTDEEMVGRCLKSEKPHFIVHTAAKTDVDDCELQREEAWQINVEGTAVMARAARDAGAKFVHLSSEYVFDGKNGPYSEEDEPNPIGYYGLTKWESEKVVRKILSQFVIARTTILYGCAPHIRLNFVLWVIDALRRGRSIRVVDDQLGSPTLADNLAEIILRMCQRQVEGVYHTVGREVIDRYSFALMIAEKFGLEKKLIQPVSTAELGQSAPRPLRAGLLVNKGEHDLGMKFFSFEEGLNQLKKDFIRLEKNEKGVSS
ncbi:MAG: dTDP-4-dehydrorhamnose reductase [Deltaproteobacteria bacterium]|nr:dTDP-4-dehydrorhamnose reductase [Deltaproteobacteria bacterium]